LVDETLPNDRLCAGKSRVGLGRISDLPLERHVPRRVAMHLRGAGLERVDGRHGRRQDLVVHLDRVGRVACQRGRVGNDYCDGVADIARRADGERVFLADLQVREEPSRRYRVDAPLLHIRAREHGVHTAHA